MCIQVKIDEDDTRESVNSDRARKLINAMGNLENIRVRGLMGISIPESSIEDRKKSFSKLYRLFLDLNKEGHELDTLSMGMSDDYKIAIQNGSNMIRIGTLLFGKRRF